MSLIALSGHANRRVDVRFRVKSRRWIKDGVMPLADLTLSAAMLSRIDARLTAARGTIETIFPSSKKLSISQNWLVMLTIAGPVSGLKGLICAKPPFPTSQGGRCKYGPA